MAARSPWGKNPIHVELSRHAWKSDKGWDLFSQKNALGHQFFPWKPSKKKQNWIVLKIHIYTIYTNIYYIWLYVQFVIYKTESLPISLQTLHLSPPLSEASPGGALIWDIRCGRRFFTIDAHLNHLVEMTRSLNDGAFFMFFQCWNRISILKWFSNMFF